MLESGATSVVDGIMPEGPNVICDCVVSGEPDGLESGVLAGITEDGTPSVEPIEEASLDWVDAGIIVGGAPPVDPTDGALESVGNTAVVEAVGVEGCGSDGAAVFEARS